VESNTMLTRIRNYELGIMEKILKTILIITFFILYSSLFIIPSFVFAQYAQDESAFFENPSQGNTFYNQGNRDNTFSNQGGGRGSGNSVGISNPLSGIADDIPGLIGYILYLARWIAGSIAVLMIVVGAYQILFSAGDPKGWEKGKQTITWAVVGFAIVLLAQVVVDIIKELVG